MKAHCLFEQSGTFKNEFKKLGIDAYDYDILNDYGQTDYQVDLYKEIRGGYDGKPSIFDNITPDDLILAFFPCTRFEAQVLLWFRGENYGQKGWDDIKKLEYDLKIHDELADNYELITKLALLVLRKNLKMVFENPASDQHYLTRYWCLKPSIIDKDRRSNGDIYKKPTQYWFIGFKPHQNLVFEPLDYVESKVIENEHDQRKRSEIHPQYANRFIRQYLIDERKSNE